MAGAYISGMVTPSAAALAELTEMKFGRAERRPAREVLAADVAGLFAFQQGAGFAYHSDGQLLWPDTIRPLYEGLPGASIGPQQRYFDTDGFWFPPVFESADGWGEPELWKWLFYTAAPAVLRVVGPYTVARTSRHPGLSDQEVAQRYGDHLGRTVSKLNHALIEVSEPSIGKDAAAGAVDPGLLEAARPRIRQWRTVIVHPGAVDAALIPEELAGQYHGVVIDATETLSLARGEGLQAAEAWEGAVVAVGVLDARTSAPDDLEWARRAADSVGRALLPGRLLVTTNDQLFYTCTGQTAQQKLQALAQLGRAL